MTTSRTEVAMRTRTTTRPAEEAAGRDPSRVQTMDARRATAAVPMPIAPPHLAAAAAKKKRKQ